MTIRIAPGICLVAALALGAGLIAPSAAHADETTTAFAQARFLSGSLLGTDLDAVVALDAATARNDGSTPLVEERHPLAVTALGSISAAPGAIRVEGVDGVTVGVIGQVASARADGTSSAAVGALGPDGAVAIGGGAGATAVVDLAQLLGGAVGAEIAQLRLEAVGIAAQAEAAIGEVAGESTIADLRLAVVVPAVTGLADRTSTALAPIESAIADLAGPSGAVAAALDRALQRAGATGILGTGASVDVGIDVDLGRIVDGLRTGVLHDRALSVDLATGEILVDLDGLTATPGLNGLAPGAEVLSPAVVDAIVTGVDRLLDRAVDDVLASVGAALRDARVSIAVDLSVVDQVQTGEVVTEIPRTVTSIVDRVTGATLGILDPATGAVTSLVPQLSGDDLGRLLSAGGSGGLLPSLLGVVGGVAAGGVATSVTTTVDRVVEPVFAAIETAVQVRIDGTLAQLGTGTAANASARAVVLGLPVALDLGLVLDDLEALIDSSGVDADAVDGLTPGILTPSERAVDGDDGSIASLLGDLVSVRAHIDDTAGGTYTRTALRVAVLDGSLATIDLAAASVGSTADGGGGTDGGTGGDDGDTTNPAGWAGLAFTGGAFPILAILVTIGLIVTGAVLTARRRLGHGAAEVGVAPER